MGLGDERRGGTEGGAEGGTEGDTGGVSEGGPGELRDPAELPHLAITSRRVAMGDPFTDHSVMPSWRR